MREQRLSLLRLATDVDALVALVGDGPELFGPAKREARDRLKRIKRDFRIALRRIRNDRGEVRAVRRLLQLSAQTVPGVAWRGALEETRDALTAGEAGKWVRT